MRPFYTLPLQTQRLINKERHSLTELKEAVAGYVHLILKTHLTEYRYDYQFGCYVWDQDFNNIQSISKWENEMENQIHASIRQYEKRLHDLQIKIKIEEPEGEENRSSSRIQLKRKINILVSGTIRMTREYFQHQEFIYFSPLSIE